MFLVVVVCKCLSFVGVLDIHCCEKSSKSKCQIACKDFLSRTNTSLQEASDGISKACGLPSLQVFLRNNNKYPFVVFTFFG